MKNVLFLLIIIVLLSFTAFSQESMNAAKPSEKDKTETIPANSYLKRGAPIGNSNKIPLAEALKDPSKYANKKVRIEGTIVRSCKMEGCWAELAPDKSGKKSVRVTMKDHSFFIPLQSAGSFARVEGTFFVKTLTKEQVDHLINEDGAKFENRNADGSVTEVSFEATGIELRKSTE